MLPLELKLSAMAVTASMNYALAALLRPINHFAEPNELLHLLTTTSFLHNVLLLKYLSPRFEASWRGVNLLRDVFVFDVDLFDDLSF